MRWSIIRSVTVLFAVSIKILAADFSIGAGAGPAAGSARVDPNGVNAQSSIGGTLLLNGGFDFFNFKSAALGVEIPLAIHGSQSSDVAAIGSNASFYTERLSAVLTPGIRVGFANKSRLSPWISFGAGVASVRRTGVDFIFGQRAASQTDSNFTVALAPAAGVNYRLGRHWFIRGEARDYIFRTPAKGLVGSFPFWNRWNNNPVFALSIGFRS